ncbi:Stomatin-like protein 1 [Strongyloides ratti]|uniref:Stomatin-like protein 1 n=1 Tax=Strongyloides ratti TaxID=34506 RepID=A0A090LTE7_STRRB|nr:Stomatin-like protein 1 [Strongyloides ratti]CEF71497.1 Stomatin-like protein 1 [Strongyloides ratti]
MNNFLCFFNTDSPVHRPEVDDEYYGVENWQDKYRSAFAPTEEELERKYLTRTKKSSSPAEVLIIALSIIAMILTFPLSIFLSIRFVRDYERMVVLRLGRLKKLYTPGFYIIVPCIDKCSKVDMRTNPLKIDKFQSITLDKGIIEIGIIAQISVEDPVASVCSLKNNKEFISSLVYTYMSRKVIKEKISDLMQDYRRQIFSDNAKTELNNFIHRYGIEIKELNIEHFEVVKNGENAAVSVFNTIIKSDFVPNVNFDTTINKNPPNSVKVRTSSTGDSTVSVCSSNTTIAINEEIDIVSKVKKHIDASLVHQVGKCYQVMCTEVGNFYVDLTSDCGYCDWGIHPSPNVIFTLSKESLFDIIEGNITPVQAYLNGTVNIKGSMFDAIKLKYLAERVSVIV